ncbi:MAG TPA: bacillithiol biosynthesis cysteine-adding enzyme BshC [Candidatus Saccharimonadales bacterium]|jgi:bacillithiol biosynthesis cysteine-adding enzyme BshC|nr:bacillithiol biosynthesis cysteine-adding enzyme BshC [Candidatus Saccharimonadales bacterium]
MDCSCISPADLPGTTRLYSAFLSDFPSVSNFYRHPPTAAGIDEAVREVRIEESVRYAVVEVLRKQNHAFGGDERTTQNLDRLRDGAVAVVTGQQVGLFGGPAYCIYKALTAIHVASELNGRGVNAVPVFWLATEDHDLAEVNHFFVPKRGSFERMDLPPSGLADRRVGDVRLGEDIRALSTQLDSLLEGSWAEEIARWISESYTPQDTFGSSYGKLMTRIFAGRGLIFLDPMSPELHRLSLPVLKGALLKHAEFSSELVARSAALEKAGFHAQVKVTEQSTLLFRIVNGQRVAIRPVKEGLAVGDKTESLEETVKALEERPEDFSPSALLRPVMQDSLLPTVAYIGGAAEVAYQAQTSLVYEKLLGRAPAILPRASFTLVPSHIAGLLKKYNLDPKEILQGQHKLRARLEAEALPEALTAKFEEGEQAVKNLLEALREPLKKLDQTLLGALNTASEKMLYQFNGLRTKAGRAEGFRSGVINTHENEIASSLLPNNALQERSFGLLTFLASEGPGLLDFLDSHIKAGSGEHCFLHLQPNAK